MTVFIRDGSRLVERPGSDEKVSDILTQPVAIAELADITVQAFNAKFSTRQMDKNFFLPGYAPYLETPPYKRFSEIFLALCAQINKDEAAKISQDWQKISEGYGTDWRVASVLARIQRSLTTHNPETHAAFNAIKAVAAKSEAGEIPSLLENEPEKKDVSLKTDATPFAKSAPMAFQTPFKPNKPQAPISALPQNSKSHTQLAAQIRKVKEEKIIGNAETLKRPAKALEKAAVRKSAPTEAEITSLTISTISDALLKIYNDQKLGSVTADELRRKGTLTEDARELRTLIAYAAMRVLPTQYGVARIADVVDLPLSSLTKNLGELNVLIKGKNAGLIKLYKAAADALPLSEYQQDLLFNPDLPRFRGWYAIRKFLKAQASVPGTPEP